MHLDHAVIGNGQVLGLVAPDTTMAWLCLPRFDSPSVFGALLDPDGGHCRVELTGARCASAYVPDTNVLRTTLTGPVGAVIVEDFCPSPGADRPPAAWVRIIRPERPGLSITLHMDVRPDYGRGATTPAVSADGLAWGAIQLRSNHPPTALLSAGPITLGGPLVLVLSHGPPGVDPTPRSAIAARDDAIEHWQRRMLSVRPWLDAAARRSALCIELHRFRTSGAIIAATTTSIPEAIGTPRCWDYRYAWIRDGAFAAEALLQAGWPVAGRDLLGFFERNVDPDAPQPLYGVTGETRLSEFTLDHWRGFEDTGPVRIGNAAAEQTQHDSFGQIIWLAERLAAVTGDLPGDRRWRWLQRLAEAAWRVRETPDAGIWEFRDRPGRYTFSRLWIWVACDRISTLADRRRDRSAATWRQRAELERAALLTAADREGYFAQTLDDRAVDASSLVVADLGLVSGDDPRFHATIAQCQGALAQGDLMQRYRIADDFGETTSTFSLCTLWWIEALSAAGQHDRARQIRAAFVARANPHGLFSEDIEPADGRLLGNFPQVYTHLGLIRTARSAYGR